MTLNLNLILILSGLFGVLIGVIISVLSFTIAIRYKENKEMKERNLNHMVKEIETLVLLNKKVNEILQKRKLTMPEYMSFDVFDDVQISVDDFLYLQSFKAQNDFYLPSFVVEDFFKQITLRRVILTPEETLSLGGYVYKDGRILLEKFSDEIEKIIQDKKVHMKEITNKPFYIFQKNF
jgi:hypothetical protein